MQAEEVAEAAVALGAKQLQPPPHNSSGEHLLCKKAGKITQVPHLVSLTRKHAVQPTS